MRAQLAERLLVEIMGWGPDEIREKRALLQAIANFKYNEYQQFSPGIRFIESLVKWLKQFETADERQAAYEFIRTQLIFFSNDQIGHLVNITFSDKINPILIEKTAHQLQIEPYLVNKIQDSREYKEHLRRSLFIGLSDGSRIDQLRRNSKKISNEQVLPTYSISDDKAKDMLAELKRDNYEGTFNTIFLIDDFTASGTSYFRAEKNKGKVLKFLKALLNIDVESGKSTEVSKLIKEGKVIDVHVIFYVATETSLKRLDNAIKVWKTTNNYLFNCSVDAIQVIGDNVKDNVLKQSAFIAIAKKYFDKSINDRHFKEAENNQHPYLGFNECSLPLVLNHNTPNNSLPILWFPEDKDHKGLFPRVTRHKE